MGSKLLVLCLTCLSMMAHQSALAQDQISSRSQELASVRSSQGVLFEKGYLFVKAEEIELNDLLFAIATQTGIAYSSFIPLEQSISVDIEWRPVAEAIAYILRDHSFVYVSTTSPRLWILPQDGGEATATDSIYMGFQLEPIDMDTSLQLQAMSDDPELREDALIDLGKSVQQDPVELFSSAISDPDFRVREAAVASLLEIGGNEAVETLTIALGDSNPRIREAAIDALGEIGGDMAISGLKQALVDDVSYVQQAAMEALDLLGE